MFRYCGFINYLNDDNHYLLSAYYTVVEVHQPLGKDVAVVVVRDEAVGIVTYGAAEDAVHVENERLLAFFFHALDDFPPAGRCFSSGRAMFFFRPGDVFLPSAR